MGNIKPRARTRPNGLTLLQTNVQKDTADRVWVAASKVDQPIAAWLRMAIIEKLDRDRQ
jgi:hypothetical protein